VTTTTPTWTEEVTDLATGKVRQLRGGTGDPLVVLHQDIGNPGWLDFHERLAQRFTVRAPDLPGYSPLGTEQAELPAWARHPRDLAIIMLQWLDKLRIDRATLVGLGFGGWIAAEMATMDQRRFGHLVLVGAMGLQPKEGEILDQMMVSHHDYVKRGFRDEAAYERQYAGEPAPEHTTAWDFNREMTARIAWKPYLFSQTLPIRLPQTAGNYWVIVVTDAANNVVELLEDNNVGVSLTPVQVAPAYSAVVSTDLEAAPANTPVPLTGRASRGGGQPATFSLVDIHIRVRGTTRTIAALTDVAGNFATTWQPLQGEAGYYEIAAGHPGEATPVAQDSFHLLGLKAQPERPSVRLSEGSSVGGSVQIENLSDVPLTGLAVELVSKPPNVII